MSELRGRRSGDPSDEEKSADLTSIPDDRAPQPPRPTDGNTHDPREARPTAERQTADHTLTAHEKLERRLDDLYWPGYSKWSPTDDDDSADQHSSPDTSAVPTTNPAEPNGSRTHTGPRETDEPSIPGPEPRQTPNEGSEQYDPFAALSPPQRDRLLHDDTVARLQYLNRPDGGAGSEKSLATPDRATPRDEPLPSDRSRTAQTDGPLPKPDRAEAPADNPSTESTDIAAGPDPESRLQARPDTDHEFVDDSSPAEMDQYRRIREADDVDALAENSGLPREVIHEAKQHLFMREHDVALGPGDIRRGYFRPDAIYGDLWERIASGSDVTAENRAQFWSLVAHEYVESKLMEAGLPYLSAEPGAWGEGNRAEFLAAYPSAHNTAPLSTQSQVKDLLRHWTKLGLPRDNLRVAPDLSNLDDVVRVAKEGLGL